MMFLILGLIFGVALTGMELTLFKDFLFIAYAPIGILLNNLAIGGVLVSLFYYKKKGNTPEWIDFIVGNAIAISILTAIFCGLPIQPLNGC